MFVRLGLGAGALLGGERAALLLDQLGVARLTEERLTKKARAVSLLVLPRLRASTIFLRKSSE